MNKEKNKNLLDKIKKLRKTTGSGVIECKKALIIANGNIDLAILNMRKSGLINAVKKFNNITSEGVISTEIKNNVAVIIEVNCQTDFVSKNEIFKSFTNKIILYILKYKIKDINFIKKKFELEKNFLISKFGENINIRRISILEGNKLGQYLHNNSKIGVIISGTNIKKDLIKKIAMHIAANKPEYIDTIDIPNEKIHNERQIQLEIVKKYKKNISISEKIIEGKLKKFKDSISLTNQIFLLDTSKTVGKVLKEKNSKINSFIRFELGEYI